MSSVRAVAFIASCSVWLARYSSYFLPLAFDYLAAHDAAALDLVTPLAWFISEYQDRLREDGALEAARGRMTACLDDCGRRRVRIET